MGEDQSLYTLKRQKTRALIMTTLEGKIVLITGASSGIGAGTAKHFASLKCRLSLVGRNQEALNNVAEECREKGAIEVLVLVKDLMAAEACRDVVSSTVAHFKSLDVLVNSAGILVSGATRTCALEVADRGVRVNAVNP